MRPAFGAWTSERRGVVRVLAIGYALGTVLARAMHRRAAPGATPKRVLSPHPRTTMVDNVAVAPVAAEANVRIRRVIDEVGGTQAV